jgi:hypothetical protein
VTPPADSNRGDDANHADDADHHGNAAARTSLPCDSAAQDRHTPSAGRDLHPNRTQCVAQNGCNLWSGIVVV